MSAPNPTTPTNPNHSCFLPFGLSAGSSNVVNSVTPPSSKYCHLICFHLKILDRKLTSPVAGSRAIIRQAGVVDDRAIPMLRANQTISLINSVAPASLGVLSPAATSPVVAATAFGGVSHHRNEKITVRIPTICKSRPPHLSSFYLDKIES